MTRVATEPKNKGLNPKTDGSVQGASIVEFPDTPDRKFQPTEWLRAIVDVVVVPAAVLDERRRILFANRSWHAFFETIGTDEARTGETFPEVAESQIGSRDLRNLRNELQSLDRHNRTNFDFNAPTRSGDGGLVTIHARVLTDPSGQGHFILLTKESGGPSDGQPGIVQFLRSFFGTSKIMSWTARGKERVFNHVSEEARSLLGFSPERWLEPGFWAGQIHPEDRKHIVAEYAKMLRTRDQFQLEYRMTRRDGETVWVHDESVVSERGSTSVMASGYLIDITERRNSEETEKRISGRLIEAQENERRRISRQLHDNINQRVALISIELEQLAQKTHGRTDGVAERIRDLQAKARELSGEIHHLSYELHPSKLDYFGLSSALRSLCREIADSRGLAISYHDEGLQTGLPKNIELCIFRVAQEAIENAVRHSGKSKVEVSVVRSGKLARLMVSDAGSGFDTGSNEMSRGLGFVSMKERLRLVNGELKVTSRRSHGTKVEAIIPV